MSSGYYVHPEVTAWWEKYVAKHGPIETWDTPANRMLRKAEKQRQSAGRAKKASRCK